MKKLRKYFILLVISYVAGWIALSTTEAGFLTLQIAAQKNSPLLARVLVAWGASPEAKGQDGMSPLHFAGYLGADQVIPLLVQKGAPVNGRDQEGRTALHLAAYAGHASSVAALMDHKADSEIKENQGGMTALHLAVTQKHGPVVRALLENGAQPSPKEKNGYTPLFIAEHEELDEIVSILEKHDAR